MSAAPKFSNNDLSPSQPSSSSMSSSATSSTTVPSSSSPPPRRHNNNTDDNNTNDLDMIQEEEEQPSSPSASGPSACPLEFYQIVELNNCAVNLLHQHQWNTVPDTGAAANPDAPIIYFRAALQTAIQLLDVQSSFPAPAQAPQEVAVAASVATVAPRRTQGQQQQRHHRPTEAPAAAYASTAASAAAAAVSAADLAHLEQDTMYDHAFVRAMNIIPDPTAYAPDPLVNLTVVSSIILFNLAIAYHRCALNVNNNADMHNKQLQQELKQLQQLQQQRQQQQRQPFHCNPAFVGQKGMVRNLLKARSLYSQSQALLVEAGVIVVRQVQEKTSSNMVSAVAVNATALTPHSHAVIALIQMSIFNNLAQSHYSLAEFEFSYHYFTQLELFTMSLPPPPPNAMDDDNDDDDQPCYDPDTAALLEWHKSSFLLNAICLKTPAAASAA